MFKLIKYKWWELERKFNKWIRVKIANYLYPAGQNELTDLRRLFVLDQLGNRKQDWLDAENIYFKVEKEGAKQIDNLLRNAIFGSASKLSVNIFGVNKTKGKNK